MKGLTFDVCRLVAKLANDLTSCGLEAQEHSTDRAKVGTGLERDC